MREKLLENTVHHMRTPTFKSSTVDSDVVAFNEETNLRSQLQTH